MFNKKFKTNKGFEPNLLGSAESDLDTITLPLIYMQTLLYLVKIKEAVFERPRLNKTYSLLYETSKFHPSLYFRIINLCH